MNVVYLIHVPEVNRVKIGRTRHAKNRLQSLQTSCPFPAHLVATYECDPSRELLLHKVFADRRVHGEWFDVPIEDVVSVASTFNDEHERIINAILKLTRRRLCRLLELTNSNSLGECLRFAIANIKLADDYILSLCSMRTKARSGLLSDKISFRLSEDIYNQVMKHLEGSKMTISMYVQSLIAADLGIKFEQAKRGRPSGK